MRPALTRERITQRTNWQPLRLASTVYDAVGDDFFILTQRMLAYGDNIKIALLMPLSIQGKVDNNEYRSTPCTRLVLCFHGKLDYSW